MKILSVLGSPRKQGNTATALGWVEDELRREGHQVARVDLCDSRLGPCVECFHCQQVTDKPGCAQKDDGNALFGRMIQSDVILLATPMFFWAYSAQLKILIDRSICLCKGIDAGDPQCLIQGKRIALLATAAGPKKGNMDLIEKTFGRYAEYLRMYNAGTCLLSRCVAPDQFPRAAQSEARTFAQGILSA